MSGTTNKDERATTKVAAHIRSLRPSLQPSDARVADAVLKDPEVVVYWSVSELAEHAGTSTATVVRCAQKLGFKGFHDLKLALARELGGSEQAVGRPGGDPRLRGLAQVAEAGSKTVREVTALVDPDAYEGAVEALATTKRVLVCGVGTSAPLAQDAAYRLACVGVPADAPADVHVQHVNAGLLDADSLLVAISHTGSTRETLDAVAAAKRAGARTIVITSFARSPITKDADYVIVAGTREVSLQLEAMASRLAHLAIIDGLLVAVSERLGERAQRALQIYSEVLSVHRL
jgi:RpiR family carbohydrate utilization transcriptional regulator